MNHMMHYPSGLMWICIVIGVLAVVLLVVQAIKKYKK